MRRTDREVTDREEMLDIMRRCDVCRLALNDGEYPYLVPLNFGMTAEDGRITLFFHSALAGRKAELMQADPRASFEMDCRRQLRYSEERGYCTMAYESVIGRGRLRILSEEEKPAALRMLMAHYHPGKEAYFDPAAIPRTLVYALDVEQLTAKRNPL